MGAFLQQFPDGSRNSSPDLLEINEKHYEDFAAILEKETIYNPWFTREFLLQSLKGISLMLEERVLLQWLSAYKLNEKSPQQIKTVGLVLAGNIPLVGFHDLMCVIAAGHQVLAKPSSKDDHLIRKVAGVISSINSSIGGRIKFTDNLLKGMDAVIATGSNNSSRYFEYYFKDIPHIIRKNRNGVAVLTGKESKEELELLGRDIFDYFGLGCRNVTKLYIPDSYDLTILLQALDMYHPYYQHHKYSNNVDYYRSIYLMNRVDFLDNEVLLVKEDQAIASPVGVVYYERYSDIDRVQKDLNSRSEEIQCVVSTHPGILDAIKPGTTQEPKPWDYADGMDTIRFLNEID